MSRHGALLALQQTADSELQVSMPRELLEASFVGFTLKEVGLFLGGRPTHISKDIVLVPLCPTWLAL